MVTSTRVPHRENSEIIDGWVREHLGDNDALYDLDRERLRAARPDVIVSQTLCDVCAVSSGEVAEVIDSLPTKPALINLEPNTLDDVFDDILRVGQQLDRASVSQTLVDGLRTRRDRVAAITDTIPVAERPRVTFLEWLIPPFNGGHWNPELVELAGGIDSLGARGKPSSTQQWETVAAARPQHLFIACCGFTAERALEDVRQLGDNEIWQQLPAVRNGRIHLADGDTYFSSPGPRLVDGLEMMAHAFHPLVHPKPRVSGCYTLTQDLALAKAR